MSADEPGASRPPLAGEPGSTLPGEPGSPLAAEPRSPLLGLAHVASCSFLASRLAPSGHFWLALGGGIALARAGERHGLRAGYGASLAAVVQTVALIGPARVSGPLTQALNAPLVGWLHARGSSRAARIAATLAIRLVHYAILNVLFVVVVIGGADAFVRTYDKVADFVGFLPTGGVAAVAILVMSALFWATFFSVIQVLVYERALGRWPGGDPPQADPPVAGPGPGAGWPALVALGAVAAAWATLLASPSWPVLGAVAGALAVAWIASRAFPREVVVLGAGLAALLAVGALVPAILGAVDWDDAVRRSLRAALLVLTATWARAALGAPRLRAAARRTLWRLRRLPAAGDAAAITGGLESDRRLGPAGRALIDEMRDVEMAPIPVADALIAWVAAEAVAYDPDPPP